MSFKLAIMMKSGTMSAANGIDSISSRRPKILSRKRLLNISKP